MLAPLRVRQCAELPVLTICKCWMRKELLKWSKDSDGSTLEASIDMSVTAMNSVRAKELDKA